MSWQKKKIAKAATQEAYLARDKFLLLQRMQPDATLGVHCLEILTILKGDGQVITAHCSMQINSNTWTSHESKNVFAVDPLTEKICGPEQWHKIREGWPLPGEDMLGRKIPGVSAMCEQAQKAHETILRGSRNDPRLSMVKKEHFRAIGWDAMITEDGKPVWFEGNNPMFRLSRYLCCSWPMMFQIRDMLSFNDAA